MGAKSWPHEATDAPEAVARIGAEQKSGGNWL